ncbi:MAG: pseudouridine synthase [Salibacteraceae bacterium]
MKYYILYKPFGYLSQFSDEDNNPGLGQILDVEKDIYPVGRLDKDSEGLLILTNDKNLNSRLLNPIFKHRRIYNAQVDREVNKEAIGHLKSGVSIKLGKSKYLTLPAEARAIEEPVLPERNPPVRFRKNVPTSWVEIKLTEGKNRQVRKMCAAVGFPCLRLVRVAIENLELGDLPVGGIKEITQEELSPLLGLRL